MAFRTGDGFRSIIVGRNRWDFRNGRWERTAFPGLRVPTYMWDGARNPRLLGTTRFRGRPVQILSVYDHDPVPAWFRLLVDARGRVLDAHMIAPSHFMRQQFSDFNGPIVIRPPTVSHHHRHGLDRTRSRRALGAVLALTAAYTVVELVAGLATDSLALLADAGHMLGDSATIALALFASWLAARPATAQRSFGYRRAEILAALANGAALVVVAIWIFIEAIDRFSNPPEILAGWVLVVAAIGLAVNLLAAGILARAAGESLNVRAAYTHVLADLAASAGVIVAALVVLTTGWRYADPLAGLAIGLLVLASSWTILRDSVLILLESTPAGIDAIDVGHRMAEVEGVVQVHDLHIWTITSGFPALSAHVLIRADDDGPARRRELEAILANEFGLRHTTLQVEHVTEQQPVQITPLRRPD